MEFHPIQFQYGDCLNPSDPFHRNAYLSSDVFGNGKNYAECVPSLVPSMYSPPTLEDIARRNTNAVNKLDTQFFNQQTQQPNLYYSSPVNISTPTDYTSPDLQSKRPNETMKNSYIRLAGETLQVIPDILLSVFFSDENIEHLRNSVVQKVKEITADSGVSGDKNGVTIQKPNMDDFFNYMIYVYNNYKSYNGSICFVNLRNNSNIKNEISKLNTSVLQDYVSKMVSQINMYIYYYKDASQLPEPLSLPELTSMKGSKTLELNVGFTSGNSMGVSSYNEVGNMGNYHEMWN